MRTVYRQGQPADRSADTLGAAGSAAPARSDALWTRYQVRLLGGFSVLQGGRDVTPDQLQPAQLIKIVALSGAIGRDELIELLWPGQPTGPGRVRVRNVLSRVKACCPDVLVRVRDSLVVGPGVSVDVRRFDELAGQSLNRGRPRGVRTELARQALALYGGRLLPGDPYADWAVDERFRLSRRFRNLVETVASEAQREGDVLGAVRLVEDALDIEPGDENLYALAAQLMVCLGWRSRAAQMVQRAERIAEQLSVKPIDDINRLRVTLGRS